jgi:hypothetical protein
MRRAQHSGIYEACVIRERKAEAILSIAGLHHIYFRKSILAVTHAGMHPITGGSLPAEVGTR